jgi:hypothetical protein
LSESSPKMGADIVAKKGKILSVLLGASRFDGLPSVESEEVCAAFLRSKQDFATYTATISSQVLDKFDSDDLPDQLCLDIGEFLKSADSPTDLILYYVGHGGFMQDTMGNSEYFLALRKTTEGKKYATGLRVRDLAQTINQNAAKLRAIILLDCCFAAEAAQYFKGGDPIADTSSKIPFGLTLFAASPPRQEAVVPPGGSRTMFSECLLDVLESGIASGEPFLSIKEISDNVRLLIEQRYPDDGVRPEVHSPRQRYGDVADYPLFPNAANQSAHNLAMPVESRKVLPTSPPLRDAPLRIFFADANLRGSLGMPVLACAVVENPDSVRKAVDSTRRRLINSTVLSLGAEVQERIQKAGFDYFLDDSDVRAKFISTISILTYEAYTCAAGKAYFGQTSEERVFCELFGRLLFDRISKHKAERIEIFLRGERAGMLEVLEGVVSSCVRRINSSKRGEVRYPPTIHMIKPRDGCIELAQYVAAIVGQRLDTGVSDRKDRRDYRRIESKVRLIQRLDTGEYFNRRSPLKDD